MNYQRRSERLLKLTLSSKAVFGVCYIRVYCKFPGWSLLWTTTVILMYVCMYVHTYVCTYVCMVVCMYVRMYVCTYVCMYVCIYVCMYVCMYIYICAYMYIYYLKPSYFSGTLILAILARGLVIAIFNACQKFWNYWCLLYVNTKF